MKVCNSRTIEHVVTAVTEVKHYQRKRQNLAYTNLLHSTCLLENKIQPTVFSQEDFIGSVVQFIYFRAINQTVSMDMEANAKNACDWLCFIEPDNMS